MTTSKTAQPVARKAAAKKAATSIKTGALAKAAATGDVRLYRQRGNGTLRRLPYLAPGTAERKAAEAVLARREKGETMPALCADLGQSTATVRRTLSAVLLARAVEAGEHDAAWDGKDPKVLLTVKAA